MNILIQRGIVKKLEELPPYSIALDGLVQGPEIDIVNHRYSFDHHSGCLRFCTISACMQTQTAILLGLDPEPYTIFCNDIDSDVCASIWCLKNASRCSEAIVSKLMNAIGIGDMHAGAVSINGMDKVVEWISAPETDSKRNDDYNKLSNEGLNSILEAMLHRIDLYVDGEAQIEIIKQTKHGEFKVLRNEHGWVLAESHDPHALSSLYHAGFDRVVLMRYQDDGSTAYTLAKRSDFISDFPLCKFYDAFNSIEKGWGGGSSIGGSPRNEDGSRSHLDSDQIVQIIDSVLSGKKRKKQAKNGERR